MTIFILQQYNKNSLFQMCLMKSINPEEEMCEFQNKLVEKLDTEPFQGQLYFTSHEIARIYIGLLSV